MRDLSWLGATVLFSLLVYTRVPQSVFLRQWLCHNAWETFGQVFFRHTLYWISFSEIHNALLHIRSPTLNKSVYLNISSNAVHRKSSLCDKNITSDGSSVGKSWSGSVFTNSHQCFSNWGRRERRNDCNYLRNFSKYTSLPSPHLILWQT